MKYIRSIDGKMRTNVTATIRLEKDELATLRRIAKHDGLKLSRWLAKCLHEGIASLKSGYDSDMESERKEAIEEQELDDAAEEER